MFPEACDSTARDGALRPADVPSFKVGRGPRNTKKEISELSFFVRSNCLFVWFLPSAENDFEICLGVPGRVRSLGSEVR